MQNAIIGVAVIGNVLTIGASVILAVWMLSDPSPISHWPVNYALSSGLGLGLLIAKSIVSLIALRA